MFEVYAGVCLKFMRIAEFVHNRYRSLVKVCLYFQKYLLSHLHKITLNYFEANNPKYKVKDFNFLFK